MPPECDQAKVVAESASAVRTATVMRFMCCSLMVVAGLPAMYLSNNHAPIQPGLHSLGSADLACGLGVDRWVVNGIADNLTETSTFPYLGQPGRTTGWSWPTWDVKGVV